MVVHGRPGLGSALGIFAALATAGVAASATAQSFYEGKRVTIVSPLRLRELLRHNLGE